MCTPEADGEYIREMPQPWNRQSKRDHFVTPHINVLYNYGCLITFVIEIKTVSILILIFLFFFSNERTKLKEFLKHMVRFIKAIMALGINPKILFEMPQVIAQPIESILFFCSCLENTHILYTVRFETNEKSVHLKHGR